MNEKKLSTEAYKGVRDFYPEDMAIQRYIFDSWSKTAESFGFERYEASILEPSDLYRSKGAENEEMVNEQTYTFIDRGEREVTLRPEMTPTVARMVAGKFRELKLPLRWYSIPNLFRYERPQRGRLREHWQLNCDIFGSNDRIADTEIIALAYQTLINFGATPEMFEIRINDRDLMKQTYNSIGITNDETIRKITHLNDRKRKITADEYKSKLIEITSDETLANKIIYTLEQNDTDSDIIQNLSDLGIKNVVFDKSLARGFDYYTGTVFEIFDKSTENNRSLIGGGRYDNLTKLFGGEEISGVGFGMGDVTMRDFLETHNLLPNNVRKTSPDLIILPIESGLNISGQKLAMGLRERGIKVAVDISTKKLSKKITDAFDKNITFALVVGPDEIADNTFTLKNLHTNMEEKGDFDKISSLLITNLNK